MFRNEQNGVGPSRESGPQALKRGLGWRVGGASGTRALPATKGAVMRDGIQQTLGKRIQAILVTEAPVSPRQQVFLIFDDDTHFEFYADGGLTWTAAVDPRGVDKVRSYVAQFPAAKIVYDSEAAEGK